MKLPNVISAPDLKKNGAHKLCFVFTYIPYPKEGTELKGKWALSHCVGHSNTPTLHQMRVLDIMVLLALPDL